MVLITFIAQLITAITIIYQSNDFLQGFLFSFTFIIIGFNVFYIVSLLAETTQKVLSIVSATVFTNDQACTHARIIRLLEMIRFNPCSFPIMGVTITFDRLVVAFTSFLGIIISGAIRLVSI